MVGSIVGCLLGISDGDLVGLSVGIFVGDIVGSPDDDYYY